MFLILKKILYLSSHILHHPKTLKKLSESKFRLTLLLCLFPLVRRTCRWKIEVATALVTAATTRADINTSEVIIHALRGPDHPREFRNSHLLSLPPQHHLSLFDDVRARARDDACTWIGASTSRK